MDQREIENLLEQGLGENKIYRDSKGNIVKVIYLGSREYIRTDITRPWEELREILPDGADVHIVRKSIRNGNGMLYVIDYYKIERDEKTREIEEVVRHLEARNLQGTAPYVQFRALMNSLVK